MTQTNDFSFDRFKNPMYGKTIIFRILPPSNGSSGKKLTIATRKLKMKNQLTKLLIGDATDL